MAKDVLQNLVNETAPKEAQFQSPRNNGKAPIAVEVGNPDGSGIEIPKGTTAAERKTAEILQHNLGASQNIMIGETADLDQIFNELDLLDDDELLAMVGNPERRWSENMELPHGPYALILPVTHNEDETNVTARGNVHVEVEVRANCTGAKVWFMREQLDANKNTVNLPEEHRIRVPGETWSNSALAAGVTLDNVVRGLLSDPNCQNPYWGPNPSASFTLEFITKKEAAAYTRAAKKDDARNFILNRRRLARQSGLGAAGHGTNAMNRGDFAKIQANDNPESAGMTLIADEKK